MPMRHLLNGQRNSRNNQPSLQAPSKATSCQPRMSKGQSNLAAAGEVRRVYIDARAADRHDIAPLLAFVRS